eukprot:4432525-Amphidinium_carterae.1
MLTSAGISAQSSKHKSSTRTFVHAALNMASKQTRKSVIALCSNGFCDLVKADNQQLDRRTATCNL